MMNAEWAGTGGPNDLAEVHGINSPQQKNPLQKKGQRPI
jgi:hypothetical protein